MQIESTDTNRSTPWGKADYQYVVARGIAWVNTPGHGGFMIARGVAKTYLSEAALRRGEVYGGYLAYEEDCDASIVLFEHPELRTTLGYLSGERAFLDNVILSLGSWNPDYLAEVR